MGELTVGELTEGELTVGEFSGHEKRSHLQETVTGGKSMPKQVRVYTQSPAGISPPITNHI